MPSGAKFSTEMVRMNLRIFARDFPARIGRAMRQETEIEKTEVVERTPRDTGELRDSIHVTGPEFEGNKIKTSIVAGGPSAPYAVHVHEDLEALHPVGEAKYIERPLFESKPYMAARVAKRVREGL